MEWEISGQVVEAGKMMVFPPGDRAGPQGVRVMLLGGGTLEGDRYIR